MIRPDLGRGVFLTVISSGRPANVPAMGELIGHATWVVPVHQIEAYRAAGARVQADGGSLCRARNTALAMAHDGGHTCVQVSDDLRKLEIVDPTAPAGLARTRPASFQEVVGLMLEAARATGARLAGVAPVANAFYYRPSTPITTAGFIVGDLMAVLPGARGAASPRFDEGLALKEDYDFTLQHLRAYGAVARVNGVLAHFRHRTNPGGACAVRTPELEQAAIARLKATWGALIRDNPKRPNEILLNLPKARAGGARGRR